MRRAPRGACAAGLRAPAAQLWPSRQRMKHCPVFASVVIVCLPHSWLAIAGNACAGGQRRPRSRTEHQQPAAPHAEAPPHAASRGCQRRRGSTGAIEAAEKAMQQLTELEEELGRLRIDVEVDPVRLLRHRRDAAPAARGGHARRSRGSGRRPAKDGPAEAPAIAAERARLTALASALDGAIKSTELTWVRARQLIEKITVLRHSLFTRNLMERLPSPLLPAHLARRDRATRRASATGSATCAEDWLQWAAPKQPLARPAVCCRSRSLPRAEARHRPPHRAAHAAQRAAAAFVLRAGHVGGLGGPAARRCPPSLAAVLLYGGLDALDLLFAPWGRAAGAVLQGHRGHLWPVRADLRGAGAPRAAMAAGGARRRADAPRRAGCSAPSRPSTPSMPP